MDVVVLVVAGAVDREDEEAGDVEEDGVGASERLEKRRCDSLISVGVESTNETRKDTEEQAWTFH